ncbi:MAG: hypothetical protein WDN69_23465 [Aliidongia sp.]
MSDKIEVKRGRKIDPADLKGRDPSTFAVLVSQAPQGAVEGQYLYDAMTQCPWCGNVGWTRGLSSIHYITVFCGRCGMAFEA